jgi:hypothetical protein
MEKPDVHNPDYWLRELRPLLDELYFAFQAALPSALKYFDEYRNKPINGPVLSNLIRYEVLEYLKGHGISAREESDGDEVGPLDGCGMNPLPNNGIELMYRGSCIRLRKGMEAPMPTTETQKGWYQQALPFEVDGENETTETFTNLLILWYSAGYRTFGGLKLLRTKGVGKKSVICDWESPVTAPLIPMSNVVPSEYSNDPDLPLDQCGDSDSFGDTGTDVH